MYLIVGLGNPESDYAKTRHNMGFNCINEIEKQNNIEIKKSGFKGLYEIANIENNKVCLLKPQTFMNSSGESVKEIMDFYKITLDELIVVYDDMDVEKGKIKIRKRGSAGSHNGMKSVIGEINSEEFTRIRIGIGKPINKSDMIDYVIGYVPEEELCLLQTGVKKAADAVIEILKNGVDSAMNKFN